MGAGGGRALGETGTDGTSASVLHTEHDEGRKLTTVAGDAKTQTRRRTGARSGTGKADGRVGETAYLCSTCSLCAEVVLPYRSPRRDRAKAIVEEEAELGRPLRLVLRAVDGEAALEWGLPPWAWGVLGRIFDV